MNGLALVIGSMRTRVRQRLTHGLSGSVAEGLRYPGVGTTVDAVAP